MELIPVLSQHSYFCHVCVTHSGPWLSVCINVLLVYLLRFVSSSNSILYHTLKRLNIAFIIATLWIKGFYWLLLASSITIKYLVCVSALQRLTILICPSNFLVQNCVLLPFYSYCLLRVPWTSQIETGLHNCFFCCGQHTRLGPAYVTESC